ncbi:MAG TPA: sialate O-acetylesterase [Chitinophagaceae bacterium]|nr:sialate O-acetylesterase [Chitinophagaceae bacterium]
MKPVLVLIVIISFTACHRKTVADRTAYFPKQIESMTTLQKKENIWVFIMAGQSNMAGRGIVEPEDTVSNKRILSINKEGQIILAKEPLHFYEPDRTGLDCGLSFAKTLIKKIPESISILMIPVAIGGSSISQWLNDSLYRNVKLFTNFLDKMEIGKRNGIIKGILWHQGESDANEKDIPYYKQRLGLLFSKFRMAVGNQDLPVLIGELGSFSENPENFVLINKAIHEYVAEDKNSRVITTKDLKDKGDHLHFNSKGQRTMGKRFAKEYLKTL